MLNVKVYLRTIIQLAYSDEDNKHQMRRLTGVTYLVSDLRTTGLFSVFGVDQSESNSQNKEERQEEVFEIHRHLDCLQKLLGEYRWNGREKRGTEGQLSIADMPRC
jgi:uncharacterized protein with gpF-like domain